MLGSFSPFNCFLYFALQVGISVLCGAITSCGAACFLLGAKMTFFFQFGIFMVTTLGFSFIWSIGFLTTCLALFGPQNDVGVVTVCVRQLCCNKRNAPNTVTVH